MKQKTDIINKISSPFINAIEASFDSLAFHSVGDVEHRKAINSVIVIAAGLLKVSRRSSLSQINAVRSYLGDNFGEDTLKRFSEEIDKDSTIDWKEISAPLLLFSAEDRIGIVSAYVKIAHSDGEYEETEHQFICELAKNLKISDSKLKKIETEVHDDEDKKKKELFL